MSLKIYKPSNLNFLALSSSRTYTAWNPVSNTSVIKINAMTIDSSNNIYVCGDFTFIGGVNANRIAKWNGTSWSSVANNAFIVFNQQPFITQVNSIAVDNSNNIYIGGIFDTVGSSFINYLAKWDGTSWTSMGVGVLGYVYSLKYDFNTNILYIGGSFNNLNNFAKWDGTSLTTVGSGVSGTVYAIDIDLLGNILIGGQFSQVGGSTSANRIAKWNGTSWSSFGTGLNNGVNSGIFSSVVYSIDVDNNNNVYVGGQFINAVQSDGSTIVVNNLAKWNGTSWSNINTNNVIGVDSYITSVYYNNNKVYIGGNFSNSGDISASRFSIYDTSNNSYNSLNSSFNGIVYSVLTDLNNVIYAAGSYSTPVSSISKYSTETISSSVLIPILKNKKI